MNKKKRIVAQHTNKTRKSKSLGAAYDPRLQTASDALKEILKKGKNQHPNLVNHHNEEELRKLRQYPIPSDAPQLPKKLPPLPDFKPMPHIPDAVSPGPTALGGNPYAPTTENRGPQQFQSSDPQPTQQTQPQALYQTQEYPNQQYQSLQYRQPTVTTKQNVQVPQPQELQQQLSHQITPTSYQLTNALQRVPFALPDTGKLVSYEDYERVRNSEANPLAINVPLDTNDDQNRWLLGSGVQAVPYYDIQKSIQYELTPAARTLRRRVAQQ